MILLFFFPPDVQDCVASSNRNFILTSSKSVGMYRMLSTIVLRLFRILNASTCAPETEIPIVEDLISYPTTFGQVNRSIVGRLRVETQPGNTSFSSEVSQTNL